MESRKTSQKAAAGKPAKRCSVVLVLCEETDVAAAWAAVRLRDRGIPVETLTGTDLATTARWEHRIGRSGIFFELDLADGRRISGKDSSGVLNRLFYLPSAWVQRVGSPDRDYALQEMYAFFLSWLHSLPRPLLNPPVPQGLCGNWRHPSGWALLACQAGLPVQTYRQSSEDDPEALWQFARGPAAATVFVAADQVIVPSVLSFQLGEPCQSLATAAGVPLLGVDFAFDENEGWYFSGASVMPDLIHGGEPLLDAIAKVLAA